MKWWRSSGIGVRRGVVRVSSLTVRNAVLHHRTGDDNDNDEEDATAISQLGFSQSLQLLPILLVAAYAVQTAWDLLEPVKHGLLGPTIEA